MIKENGYELNIFGVRKSEGGARSAAYKNCYDNTDGDYDNYRPIFGTEIKIRLIMKMHMELCIASVIQNMD